jgi:hypothetical protein
MRIAVTQPLFPWDCLEDSPTLTTIRETLAAVPDAKLLESLRTWRGRGRNDYPVAVLWAVHLLTVLLRHPSTEATLAELRRNPALRRLIGIESEAGVPEKWNMSRFEAVLGREPHRTLLVEIFNTMIHRLGGTVDDLGRDVAGDATGLLGRRLRSGEDDGDLPGPTGGRKEYTDEAGNVTRIVEWFGYKLHLLVDVKHEVALGYRISSANVNDCVMFPAVLDDALANLPAGRIETLAYDKAADDNDTHKRLAAEHISPLIQNRCLWKDDFERMLPGHDGTSNVVYDEAGTLYCYDTLSDPPVRHRMAYIGHEPSRGTLKYRCPAMQAGWRCPSRKRCNGSLKYGKTVRVKREIDLRRFPPIPRATKKFERLYKGRTAVERVNARLKIFWGADDGNVTGPARFHAKVAAVMIVHAALATLLACCPRREGMPAKGTLGQTRLSPIAQALRETLRL